jgi:hypothetical protein
MLFFSFVMPVMIFLLNYRNRNNSSIIGLLGYIIIIALIIDVTVSFIMGYKKSWLFWSAPIISFISKTAVGLIILGYGGFDINIFIIIATVFLLPALIGIILGRVIRAFVESYKEFKLKNDRFRNK